MGFWDKVNGLWDKAQGAYDKLMSSNYMNDFQSRIYGEIESRTNDILDNPSAYSKEQVERAKEYQKRLMRTPEGDEDSDEESEGYYEDDDEYYEDDEDYEDDGRHYEDSEDTDDEQIQINKEVMERYLSGVMPESNLKLFNDLTHYIAKSDISDSRKELLDEIGISYSYYIKHSVIREFYKALSNLYIDVSDFKALDDFSELYEFIDDSLSCHCEDFEDHFVYGSLKKIYSKMSESELVKFFPTPDIENPRFIPILVFATEGFNNLENGFAVYAISDNGKNVKDLILSLRITLEGDEIVKTIPFNEIFHLESSQTVVARKYTYVMINDNYFVLSRNVDSEVLEYILNLFLFVEWGIGNYKFLFSRLRFIEHYISWHNVSRELDSFLLDEATFLKFLQISQGMYEDEEDKDQQTKGTTNPETEHIHQEQQLREEQERAEAEKKRKEEEERVLQEQQKQDAIRLEAERIQQDLQRREREQAEEERRREEELAQQEQHKQETIRLEAERIQQDMQKREREQAEEERKRKEEEERLLQEQQKQETIRLESERIQQDMQKREREQAEEERKRKEEEERILQEQRIKEEQERAETDRKHQEERRRKAAENLKEKFDNIISHDLFVSLAENPIYLEFFDRDFSSHLEISKAVFDYFEKYHKNRQITMYSVTSKKFQSKQKKLVSLYDSSIINEKNVLFFYDNSIFGTAKEGFVLTKDALFYNNIVDSPRMVNLNEINSIVAKERHISINGFKDIECQAGIGLSEIANALVFSVCYLLALQKANGQTKNTSQLDNNVGWVCQCGAKNIVTSKFCAQCGAKKPDESSKWICSNCNAENLPTSKFCDQCGKAKP